MASKLIQRICLQGNRGANIDKLRKAASYDGCFYIGESPFSEIREIRKQCLEELNNFYRQDLDKKKQIGQNRQRGYFQIGDESGDANLIEKKESFSYGYDDKKIPKNFMENSAMAQVNLFPEQFNQENFFTLLDKLNETASQTIDLCSEAFETDFNSTLDITSQYQSFLKSFRYYGKSKTDTVETTGNSLHSDWNLLTLVWADYEGLELLRDDKQFVKVHPENQDDLICNYGDFMASLTKGQIRSPWHKVTQPPSGIERNSLILFFYPKDTFEAQKTVIEHQGKPLGLFVDQSKPGGHLWDIPQEVQTMGQMYSKKWEQVKRY